MQSRAPGWIGVGLGLALGWFAPAPSMNAFPPAPHHLVYGNVRDEFGNPLVGTGAQIILESASGVTVHSTVISGLGPGLNYRLKVPMDAGITEDLYQPTALRPTLPFKIHVLIGQTLYLPIEMQGDFNHMGEPGQRTRLDLTLGEDSDGDGFPDAWERALIAAAGRSLGLEDIDAGDDFDGDGLSNEQEYLSGSYAFDSEDGFALKAVPRPTASPLPEFLAIRGRTYSILRSSDMKTWTPVSFRIPGDDAWTDDYYADDVRQIQAEVSPDDVPPPIGQVFFKLMVQ